MACPVSQINFPRLFFHKAGAVIASALFFAGAEVRSEIEGAALPYAAGNPAAYQKLDLEQLMNIEVTSVSRRPEKLSETASAIQVITSKDISRSGATRLPEALRLATNLEVAQLDSSQWAISARGFNSPLANKMLVMIDGRTIYSPLFAGVFWDTQDVLLEDVDQIEVISGPGATLWGANAVNGVINITTKSAKDTQGLYVEGGGGTELRDFGAVRYGGTLTPRTYFRIYGKYAERDSSLLPDGQDANNPWRTGQGGFRLDSETANGDLLTLQGDVFEENFPVGVNENFTKGGNLLGRWSHTISEHSDFRLQAYADQVHRNVPGSYDDLLNTYDVDFQQRFPWGARNDLVWGAGYRVVRDNFRPGILVLVPARLSLTTYNAFVQDVVALVPDSLDLTVGTKVEHNDYSRTEIQPSVRLAWKANSQQTVWAAISRAVRTPSRIDRDLIIPPATAGGPNFDSEKLVAYELGYRVSPNERLSFSLAAYDDDYDDLRSVEEGSPPAPIPLIFANGQTGKSYGAELTVDYSVTDWWRLHVGYSELRLSIHPKPGSTDTTYGAAEAADARHHFSLRSSLDLPAHFSLDATFRLVSRITNPDQQVPGYGEVDLRVAWRPTPQFEASIVGQNLLHSQHVEFGAPAVRQEIERAVYGKVAFWR